MKHVRMLGRAMVVLPCEFVLILVIVSFFNLAVTRQGVEWLLWGGALILFTPTIARLIVWLDNWYWGADKPAPDQPRKPEQLSLWEAKR